MFKVMLIDDEPWIIDGLKHSIHWEEEGFQIIGTAYDAVEGMEQIEKLQPDVVFADVRMPEVSGLELARRVKELGLAIEFVIVSGYAEFQYAKEAISIGVIDYLLKPISKDALAVVVKKVKRKLDAALHIRVPHNIELINRLSSMADLKETSTIFSQWGWGSMLRNIRVAFINYEGVCEMTDAANSDSHRHILLPVGKNRAFVISNYEGTWELIEDSLADSRWRESSIVGVSREWQAQKMKWKRMFDEAEIASFYDFIYGKSGVYFYSNPKYAIVIDKVNQLDKWMRNKDFSSVYGYLDKLRDDWMEKQMGIEELCMFYNQLLSIVQRNLQEDQTDKGDFISCESFVLHFHDFPHFIDECMDIFTRLESAFIPADVGEYRTVLKKIVEYMNQNYDKQIHLQEIAKQFYMNASYISVLFRKVTGKTFSQFLAEIRMNRACLLLDQTDKSIDEICLNVGYSDYYSFIKAFKKQIGKSPGKYRKGEIDQASMSE